jgi:formyl-CoA transferase
MAETATADAAPLGPLSDLVVIELGTLIAGPFCGQVLGDFGAEVIKIEPPTGGDPMRGWGQTLPSGLATWWPVIGRNKKSVTLDLRKPEGQALARKLIAGADVVIENFRPGTMEKWGLSYEALAAENPGLVMARVSGFGQTGPYSGRAGFGLIGEAMGGMRALTGEPDRPPSRAGISIGDSLTGLHAAMGVMMALHARRRTGKGQVVDAALYESVLAVMESLITDYDLAGYMRQRSGSILPGIAPSNVYPAAGGEMILIGANGDNVYARLTEAMGRPDLATDPRFADHASRGVNQTELDRIIGEWTGQHTLDELLPRLETHGVPASRLYRAPDMIADPQFVARSSIVEAQHPELGEVRMQNTFPRMTATPGQVRWPGPALGEHTEAVLSARVGCSADELRTLKERGVV